MKHYVPVIVNQRTAVFVTRTKHVLVIRFAPPTITPGRKDKGKRIKDKLTKG